MAFPLQIQNNGGNLHFNIDRIYKNKRILLPDNLAAITNSEQEYENISSVRKCDRPRNYKETEQVQYEVTEDSDQHILNVAHSSLQETKFEHTMKKDSEEWATIAKLINDKVNEKESQIETLKRSLSQLQQNLEDTQQRLREIEDDRNSLLKQVEELQTNHAKEITERVAKEIKLDTQDHLLEHQIRRLQANKNQIGEKTNTHENKLIFNVIVTVIAHLYSVAHRYS